MYRIAVILTFALLFFTNNLVAQTKLSSLDYESKIYNFAGVNNEDSMLYYYKMAKKNKVLINTMQRVLGNYYFYKNDFSKALSYYEEAFKFDKYNTTLHYNMTVCNGYLGLTDRENFIAERFNEKQKEYYGIKKHGFINAEIYCGYFANNNLKKNANLNLSGNDSVFGKIVRTGALKFLYAATAFKINSRFNVYASINYNGIGGNTEYQFKTPEPPPNKDTTKKPHPKFDNKKFDYNVKQNIFCTKFDYQINFNLKAKVAYTLLNTYYTLKEFEKKKFTDDKKNDRDTIMFRDSATNIYEALIGLMLNYRKPHYSIDVRAFYLPFSTKNFLALPKDSNRMQADISIAYFPFQQYKGYVRFQASVLNTEKTNPHLVFTYDASYKIYRNLWANVTYQHNNLKNFIDAEGAIIYNTDDIVKNKFTIKFLYYFGKHIEASVQLGIMNRKGTYQTFDNERQVLKINYITYRNNIFIGGLKWIF